MTHPIDPPEARAILEELIKELVGAVGFADLLQIILEGKEPYADDVERCAERALELANRLLEGLPLTREPRRGCVLGEVVLELEPSLRRVVGSSTRVAVRIAPSLDIVPPGRRDIEGLLLHLVAAARDADPGSGPIAIRTTRGMTSAGRPIARLVVEDHAGSPRMGDLRWFLMGPGPADLMNPLTPFVERMREAGGSVRIELPTSEHGTLVVVELPTDGADAAGLPVRPGAPTHRSGSRR